MISNAGTGSDETALITTPESPYFKYPFTLLTLPSVLQRGLIPLGTMGLLSFLSSFALLIFIFSRFITSSKQNKSSWKRNQYLILFLNLLFADMIQAMSFVISFWWLHVDGILAPTRACQIQGVFLNIGNVVSGFFVLFIACHTFYGTVKGRRLPFRVFMGIVIAAWATGALLTCLGPALHGRYYFVRTGAWCWASALYETERLALHYIWIFFVQFATMLVYLAVYIHIKVTMRRTAAVLQRTPGRKDATHAKIDRAARSMIFYPLFYIILTLPLSAARMWSIAHGGAFLPPAYVVIAGTFISSTGLVDCLLYTVTRRQMMSTGSTNATGSQHTGSEGRGTTSEIKRRLSRPNIARAISARSLKPLGANPPPMDGDVEKGFLSPNDASQGRVMRSVSLGLNIISTVTHKKPDPFGLDSIDLERSFHARSCSAPVIPKIDVQSLNLDLPGTTSGSQTAAEDDEALEKGSVIVRESEADGADDGPVEGSGTGSADRMA